MHASTIKRNKTPPIGRVVLLSIILVLSPFGGINVYIRPYLTVIMLVADDVVVITTLEYI